MGDVLLGNINPGLVTADFMQSVLEFAVHDGQDRKVFRGYVSRLASGCVDLYRNMIVEQFLDTDYEYLWFVDSDVVIDNTTLYKLMDHCDVDHPVVSGIYPILGKLGQHPSMYDRSWDEEVQRTTMMPYLVIPEDEIVEVQGVGAGCLLLHRSILEQMRVTYPKAKPWFDMIVVEDVPYGEDFTFCLRVTQMGYPILVNTKARCVHQKLTKLGFPKELAHAQDQERL